jgi:hypothetical protein
LVKLASTLEIALMHCRGSSVRPVTLEASVKVNLVCSEHALANSHLLVAIRHPGHRNPDDLHIKAP